jgi:hypothetical protein
MYENKMATKEFNVSFCYYGMRDTLVTHIKNLDDIANYLETIPEIIKIYFEKKLNKQTVIEGKTLKISGLITKPAIDSIISELYKEKNTTTKNPYILNSN